MIHDYIQAKTCLEVASKGAPTVLQSRRRQQQQQQIKHAWVHQVMFWTSRDRYMDMPPGKHLAWDALHWTLLLQFWETCHWRLSSVAASPTQLAAVQLHHQLKPAPPQQSEPTAVGVAAAVAAAAVAAAAVAAAAVAAEVAAAVAAGVAAAVAAGQHCQT